MAVDKKNTAAKKYSRIYDLGEETVDRIDLQLIKGVSANMVTDLIQKEWGMLIEVKHATLSKQLQRYKKDVLDIKLQRYTSEGKREVLPHLLYVEPETKIDIYNELQELAALQMGRVNKLMALESTMPTLMGHTRYEIKELRDLLKQISELQFDMGLVKRQPKKILGTIDIFHPGGEEDERKFLESMESQHYVDEATHEVFSLLEEMVRNGLDIEDGEVIEYDDSPDS